MNHEFRTSMDNLEKLKSELRINEEFRKKPLDDTVSKQLFKEYLDSLDPTKIYLTKEDAAKFAK